MNRQKHLICGEVKATEIETETVKETNVQFATNSVKTWYGDVTYSEAKKRDLTTVPGDTETEYDNYDFEEECKNGKIGYTELANEEVKRVYIYEKLNEQINKVLMPRIIESEEVKITTAEQEGNDIFDEYLKNIIDETSKAHFYNWTVKGLLTIGTEDEGSYDSNFGEGQDNDYVYSKYTKNNIKQFDTVSKTCEEVLDIGNSISSANNVDAKLKQFLELLRNKTGKRPEEPGDEGGFTGKDENPSIVVKYDDIYEGTIPAGDLLLDNGAEMLFKLLEQYDNTQGLVNIFKYLAYLYTGKDYGVSLEDIQGLISSTFSAGGLTSISDISPFSCSISRKDFISYAKAYLPGNGSYQSNMAAHAGEFYDICTSMNVNPVIAYAHSCLETGYGSSIPYNNYFGMAVYNGAASGSEYSSAADSIKSYCNWVINNGTPGSSAYSQNLSRASQWSKYNNKLAGTPDTNIYALYCRYAYLGDKHYCNEPDFNNPKGIEYYQNNGSTWGHGGRIYIYTMYETGALYKGRYKELCGHPNANDPTTDQEKADYAVYSTDKRIEIAKDIFGISAFAQGAGTFTGDTYIDNTGKTFNLYKQNDSTNKSKPYPARGPGATIGANGCGPSSCCIISSGYGYTDTPSSLVAGGGYYSSVESIQEYFNSRGFETIKTTYLSNNEIKEYLNQGYKIVVRVTEYANCGGYSLTAGQAHFYTFLGVDGNKVFVGDPIVAGGRMV